ncbi:MAG: hypothetical protein WDO16_21130 [Bacteroidota bacterium]
MDCRSANPDHYPNEFGEFNSVIKVGKPYLFYFEGHLNAKQVVLTGSFNNWRDDELFMKKNSKGWELSYTLGPGNYDIILSLMVNERRLLLIQMQIKVPAISPSSFNPIILSASKGSVMQKRSTSPGILITGRPIHLR